MTSSHKEFLIHFGWSDFFENQLVEYKTINTGINPDKLRPARVINEERNLYRLQFSNDKIVWSAISGKMQFNAFNRHDYPAVGDWVLAELPENSERSIIHHVFKRKTVLARKQVGSASDIQILSTNIDIVYITTSMNGDLNNGRLERYLTFAWDSGARPIILLTKSDLYTGSIEQAILDLKLRFNGVEIYSLTKNAFEETDCFRNYLTNGNTAVLVGSSGVGKSTIGNFLIGREEILIQEIRADDDKGRHTTTSRSLYESIYGGMIIDTPGMRELQFSVHEEGLQTQFADIEELITNCRYGNCKHQTEPDCAILNALVVGILDEIHWKSFKKISAEIRFAMRKQDKQLFAEDRKTWKKDQ